MALSRGAGLKREGPSGTAPGKAWPLLFSASAHPLGGQFDSDADGDAGASWGEGGVVRLPRFVCDGMVLTVMDALSFFGRTMSKLLTIGEASEYLGISKLTLYG